jgi:hypothetical protein
LIVMLMLCPCAMGASARLVTAAASIGSRPARKPDSSTGTTTGPTRTAPKRCASPRMKGGSLGTQMERDRLALQAA